MASAEAPPGRRRFAVDATESANAVSQPHVDTADQAFASANEHSGRSDGTPVHHAVESVARESATAG